MKLFFVFGAALTVGLSGCGKQPAATDHAPATDSPAPATNAAVAFTPETGSLLSTQDVSLLEQINRENIRVANAAKPSVVRVTAMLNVDPRLLATGRSLPFHFHLPGPPRTESEPSYGSGVVISRDGYLVTNNHVIEGSSDIEVQLADRRIFAAQVVAADAMVDVAILKIDAHDLVPLPWGDSDQLEVGEQVFAVGNPFNLEDSVSKGIVSAKGRNLETSSYEDYIQTDSPINPGNSGGALVNVRGELIGINAAIASNNSYFQGVGFAIPSNLVRYAVEGLLKEGKLVRGFLGVRLPEAVDQEVIGQLNLKTDQGALLTGVLNGAPADKAGLRAGDFITRLDGHKIESVAGLKLVVAQIPVGKEVPIAFIRGGVAQSATVKVTEPPTSNEAQTGIEGSGEEPAPRPAPARAGNVLAGLQVGNLDDNARRKFGVDPIVAHGVVVTVVQSGSAAEQKGLIPGDVIESVDVNRAGIQSVDGTDSFASLTKDLKTDQGVVLLVHPTGGSHTSTRGSSFLYLAPAR